MEGQRWMSMLVDLAFFGVIAVFGLRHVLSEGVLATLLSAYAAHRFGVAMGKQQAVIALSGTGTSVPPSGGSGTSGEHRLKVDPSSPQPPTSQRVDPRTLRETVSKVTAAIGWIG